MTGQKRDLARCIGREPGNPVVSGRGVGSENVDGGKANANGAVVQLPPRNEFLVGPATTFVIAVSE
jgi:hypothetical protein